MMSSFRFIYFFQPVGQKLRNVGAEKKKLKVIELHYVFIAPNILLKNEFDILPPDISKTPYPHCTLSLLKHSSEVFLMSPRIYRMRTLDCL